MTDRPPNTAELTAIQVLDSVPGLRLADRDWRALAAMKHPVKVALWLAMLRTREELESRANGIEMVGGELSSIPAIVSWAEAAVRRGMGGDMTAWAMVADRIEGKVGTRRDEVDPEDERRRGDIQSVIEAVVTGLTNARLANPSDDALDVTPIDMSTERQDSDSVRRQEIQEAAQREEADAGQRGSSLIQTNQEPEERDLSGQGEAPPVGRR